MSSQDTKDVKPDLSKSKNTNNERRSGKKGRFKGRRFAEQQKFKGKTEGLKGHVYNVGTTTQAEQFTETTKKLASYAGHTCKEPQDIPRAIEDLKDVTVPVPTERTSITNSALHNKIYDKDIEIWSKRKSLYRQKNCHYI